MLRLILEGVENIAGKAENAGYQHYLFFHKQCYQKLCPEKGGNFQKEGGLVYRKVQRIRLSAHP